MNARSLLFRQLQQFFEMYLAQRWRISDVVFSQPEMPEKIPGVRQRPCEIVRGSFGDFTLSIYSTVEEPPLGKIVCADLFGETVEGVIDEATWGAIASMINSRERGAKYVNR